LNENSVRILIAEGVPSLNKGELAILIGMLKTFETLGKAEVSIFSYYPSIDKERYPKNIKIVDVGSDLFLGNSLTESSESVRFGAYLFAALQHFFFALLFKIQGRNALKVMNRALWREYCESDIIIICHDGVDFIGGWILNFSPIYITLLAKVLHKSIVIYANGGTGFKRKIWKILAKYVLNYVTLITVRDEESFSYLKSLPLSNARIFLTGDPAILLPAADDERVKGIMLEENLPLDDGLVIGVILSHETLLHGSYRNNGGYKELVTEIAELLDRLIMRYQATIVFIPHCIDPLQNKDDRLVSKRIYNAMKNKNKAQVMVKEYSPEELKGLMGQLDLLISSRVHASIGSLSMNVPTCTIAYSSDRRAHGLVGKMLKQEKWIYNIENLNVDAFFKLITELMLESGKIRKDLPSIVNSAKQKALLNGRLLRALLNS
jgi:polysaccharide pyruvyl transferase WcaK-like protein